MKQSRVVTITAILVVIALSSIGATVGQSPQSAPPDRCSFPFSKTDATGTTVTIENEPNRVVTLQPSATQTMWEIGAQKKVVGLPISQHTAYLNGTTAANRTDITEQDGYTTNIETVVSLQPDLVLAPNIVSNETVEKLRNAGVTVYKFEFGHSITDIYNKTHLTGQLVGECQGANQRVTEMNKTVSSIKSSVEHRKQPRVLYLMGGGVTSGKGTFIDTVITAAGGDNIAANAGITGYEKINPETVIKQNPQWIVLGSNTPSIPNRATYSKTTALKTNQTVVVNSSYISQPAPRVVIPMKTLAKSFHPGAFEQQTTTATAPTDANETHASDTGSTNNAATTGTTDATGPGFGIVAGVLALLISVMLARR